MYECFFICHSSGVFLFYRFSFPDSWKINTQLHCEVIRSTENYDLSITMVYPFWTNNGGVLKWVVNAITQMETTHGKIGETEMLMSSAPWLTPTDKCSLEARVRQSLSAIQQLASSKNDKFSHGIWHVHSISNRWHQSVSTTVQRWAEGKFYMLNGR